MLVLRKNHESTDTMALRWGERAVNRRTSREAGAGGKLAGMEV